MRTATESTYQKKTAPARPVLERMAFSQLRRRTWFIMLMTSPMVLTMAPTAIVKPKKERILVVPWREMMWSMGRPTMS